VNYPQSLKFETGDSITFEISLASSAVERGYQNHVAAATGPSTNVTEANQAPDTAGLNVTATTTKVYALNVTLS
jgi:hypothetical protein